MSIVKIKDDGNQWVPIQTISGEDGKSAYEYAVEGGYQGTESQFAQKLADEYVTDVQMRGTSVLSNGVANIPGATAQDFGVIKLGQGFKTDNTTGSTLVDWATADNVKAGISMAKAINPYQQHKAVFYGLTKAAGVDMDSSSNAVGTYTDSAKTAIKTMIGVPDATYDLNLGTSITTNADLNTYTTPGIYNADNTVISSITHAPTTTTPYKLIVESTGTNTIKQIIETTDGNTYIRTGDSSTSSWVFENWVKNITDVQLNGASVTSNGVANILMSNTFGLYTDSGYPQHARVYAARDDDIKTANYTNVCLHRPITPYNQHTSVFYGLAKAAGDSTQSASSNAVGTYTSDAKAAIKSMLGVNVDDIQINSTSIVSNGVANIPIAGASAGVITCGDGTDGVYVSPSTGKLVTVPASSALIKAGTNAKREISPEHQHEAVFYGLAKAAGADMASSNNAVGTYTDAAKNAIKTMLGTTEEANQVFNISGTDPTITGLANVRYMCGEVYTLSITPPATGTIDVVFTSGSSPTVLTLPNTVIMPDWWAGVETNRTYEIIITDGVYAGVMSWPTT